MTKSLKNKPIHIILIITVLIIFTGKIPVKAAANGMLKVHFIDVGDADCILIQQGIREIKQLFYSHKVEI